MDKIKVPVVPEIKCQTSYASSVVNLRLQTNGGRLVIDSKLFPIVVLLFGRDARLLLHWSLEIRPLIKKIHVM